MQHQKNYTKWLCTTVITGALVSACTQTVDTFCLNYTPITYSASNDTRDTVSQIKEQNAVWSRLCK
jgi:hypothetical protein